MPYFKDHQQKVHFLESADFAYLLPLGSVAITEEEARELSNPPETAEQVIARLEKVLDEQLDVVAQEYRYESIRTMVTYATSDHPKFGPEGRAAVRFRDDVYAIGIAKIAACTREIDPEPIPTEAELIAELPDFATYITT